MVVSTLRYMSLVISLHLFLAPAYSQRESVNDAAGNVRELRLDHSVVVASSQSSFGRSSKGGCWVEIHLRDGSAIYGELLSIQDSSVSLLVYPEFS